MNEILSEFLYVKNMMQIYHWQTTDYARHKASGDFYTILDAQVDRFIEAMQKNKKRINVNTDLQLENVNDDFAIEILESFIDFLVTMNIKGPDLLTIRDEMVENANKTLYLFTLD